MENIFAYIILPFLIFISRVIDVSLGTIRIIFVSKGFKGLSFLIGFIEVMIWLVAVKQVLSDLSNVWIYLAYAGGFATGNYFGIWLDERISLGTSVIKVIIRKNHSKLIKELEKNNYQITITEGKSGTKNIPVKIIFCVVERKELKEIFKIIKKVSPNAFYTVEDIKGVRKLKNQQVRK